MTPENFTELLTNDEKEVIALLSYVAEDASEFDDPENGDYLERMDRLFRNSSALDSRIVKIVIDRTHFFMGDWTESHFNGSDSYEVTPETSEATDLLLEARPKTAESEGVKAEILKLVDDLQVTYFWRDAETPDTKTLRKLVEVIVENKVRDETLSEFIGDNILFPWAIYLEEEGQVDEDGYSVDLTEWNELRTKLGKSQLGEKFGGLVSSKEFFESL